MTDLQTERAFQKQEGLFLNSKKVMAKKTSSGVRFYKKIGLGKCSWARPCARDSLARLRSPVAEQLLTACACPCRLQDAPDGDRGPVRGQEVPVHGKRQHQRQNLQVSNTACAPARSLFSLQSMFELFINNYRELIADCYC